MRSNVDMAAYLVYQAQTKHIEIKLHFGKREGDKRKA